MARNDLSFDDLRLLAALQQTKTLQRLSTEFRRDKSVISRRLKDLADRSSALEKVGNQWRLTEIGRRLTALAMDFEADRQRILGEPGRLTITGSRLFVAAFLAPRALELREWFGARDLTLVTHDGAPERLLLDGACDLAITCGKPSDPAIAFKQSVREPFLPCGLAAPSFAALQRLPHVAYCDAAGNLPFAEFLTEETPIAVRVNDPMALLHAAESGAGWTVLPSYAIPRTLRRYEDAPAAVERYGIWWLRSRRSQADTARKALEWLGRQRLD